MINRGFTITGQVADAKGQSLSNAEIKILSGDPNKRQGAKTDEQGCFTMTGVEGETAPDGFSQQPPLQTNAALGIVIRGMVGLGPLHADLAIQAQGYASQRAQVKLLNATNLANFTLAQGKIFRGQIVDEAGVPISTAVVRTDYDFKNQVDSGFEWLGATDRDGRFEWDSAPTQEICYWFEADGYEIIRGLALPADGRDHTITLRTKATR